MSGLIKTSVVIPHYTKGNNTAVLKSVIDSVLTQNEAKSVEVIVVCNPPSHEVAELQALYGASVQVLSTTKANVNIARNLGLKTATGKNILFLDDDCVLEDQTALNQIEQNFAQDENLVACGGDVQLPEKVGFWDLAYFKIQKNWIRGSQRPDASSHQLFGGFLAVRASKLNGAKFEEKIAFGGAEIGFVSQLQAGGAKIKWLEDLKVLHYSRLDFGSFLYRAFKQGASQKRRGKSDVYSIVTAETLRPLDFSERLYQLVFSFGGGSYWKPLKHFIKISFKQTRFGSRWIELRQLAKVWRVLIGRP